MSEEKGWEEFFRGYWAVAAFEAIEAIGLVGLVRVLG
jgi:hypothetical protein